MTAEIIAALAEGGGWVLSAYLVLRMTQQESRTLQAFREGADSQKQMAAAIMTLQVLERELSEMRREIRELREP